MSQKSESVTQSQRTFSETCKLARNARAIVLTALAFGGSGVLAACGGGSTNPNKQSSAVTTATTHTIAPKPGKSSGTSESSASATTSTSQNSTLFKIQDLSLSTKSIDICTLIPSDLLPADIQGNTAGQCQSNTVDASMGIGALYPYEDSQGNALGELQINIGPDPGQTEWINKIRTLGTNEQISHIVGPMVDGNHTIYVNKDIGLLETETRSKTGYTMIDIGYKSHHIATPSDEAESALIMKMVLAEDFTRP